MIVETAGKLSLLKVGSNVLVRHLMLPSLDEVVFLVVLLMILKSRFKCLTSSSDQALPPPVDDAILRGLLDIFLSST